MHGSYNDYQNKNKVEYFLEIKAGPQVPVREVEHCWGGKWRAVCRQHEPLTKRRALAELKRCLTSTSTRKGWLFRVRRVETRTQVLRA